ncbi:MAG: GMC family oxidoreductase [Parachlamydiaceae bacterium]|nr:GMC family oxidoreductase [Parachlamydiaceae bacterium]
MKIKIFTLALITATASLFGDQLDLGIPYQCNKSEIENLEADIIVVGGGAAGCVLMNQLSKNGLYSVLGIEGGPNLTNDPAIEAVGIPALLLATTGRYKFFWPGWSQTLPMAGLNGRVSDWTTGMLLGGGSSVNSLYYGRGSNTMYKRWEEISGSENWSLDKILATFKTLENYHGLTITPGARGHKGNLDVLQTPTVSQLTTKVLLPATQAAFPGIPTVLDYNDPSVGNCISTRAQWFIDPTGTKRASSATAFLNSSVMTPDGHGVNGHKLRVLFDSVAVKLEFDKHRRAKTVKFIKDGQLYEARARKAVVLASGINSSKLLQLSGIGPSKVLKDADIKPTFINKNVGKHLQNHPLLFITLLADPAHNGIPAGAPYSYTIHNVYLPAVGGSSSDPRMLQVLFEYVPASAQLPVPLIVIGFELLNPKSEGSVTIQSDNSYQLAAVDDGFYKDPVDLKNMKDGIKIYIRHLLDQLALLSPDTDYYRPIFGDPFNLVILSDYKDSEVESYVKNNTNLTLDVHHFTSHCKMAPLNAGGVVDGNTRVYGTKNVYVADDSICPLIPDINTAGPAMMIGLRTSQILKSILSKKEKLHCKKQANTFSSDNIENED